MFEQLCPCLTHQFWMTHFVLCCLKSWIRIDVVSTLKMWIEIKTTNFEITAKHTLNTAIREDGGRINRFFLHYRLPKNWWKSVFWPKSIIIRAPETNLFVDSSSKYSMSSRRNVEFPIILIEDERPSVWRVYIASTFSSVMNRHRKSIIRGNIWNRIQAVVEFDSFHYIVRFKSWSHY